MSSTKIPAALLHVQRQNSSAAQDDAARSKVSAVAQKSYALGVEHGAQQERLRQKQHSLDLAVLRARVAGHAAAAEMQRIKLSGVQGLCYRCHTHPSNPQNPYGACASCVDGEVP